MWSWPGKPVLQNIARHQGSTLISSKPSQPVYDSQPVERYPACAWRSQHVGKYLREGLPLEIDIGSGVLHRRVEGSVAEPLADRCEVHAGLHQMNAVRVPTMSLET